MFRRTYKVKGEDVDDFMIMQDFAYYSYASSILKSYLFEKGYSKHKLNTLKIDFQEFSQKIIYQKHLMFTQSFFVNLEFIGTNNNGQKINIRNRFFNTKNELCVTASTQLYWFDNSKEVIAPPKPIIEHVLIKETFAPLPDMR